MGRAARAIIIEDGKILVMMRSKHGSQYFTLPGGTAEAGEAAPDTLAREMREETGLEIVSARFVYHEDHPAPYNQQYVYLCEAAEHGEVSVQPWSEEGKMNDMGITTHKLMWVDLDSFKKLPFRTQQLQEAIVLALNKGFPEQPVSL